MNKLFDIPAMLPVMIDFM